MIKKGDNVKILTGKDRGKTGKVAHIDYKTERVILEGLNLYKKHIKPRREGEKGQIVEIPRSMHISNIGIFCASCKKATRIGIKTEKDKKIRFCRKCKNVV